MSKQFFRRHRRALVVGVVLIALAGFLYFVLPQIRGLSSTLRRLRHADPWWIGLAVVLEATSLAGYVLLFRTVFSCHDVKIGWRESYEINLAGTVATKFLATAGAGGVALTVWALRASGLSSRAIARRMVSFELLLYSVFAGALLIVGLGLRTGVLPGRAPWTLTLMPAAVAAGAIIVVLALRSMPAGIGRRLVTGRSLWSRTLRLGSRLTTVPRMLREATTVIAELVRGRRVGVLGAVLYWGFDIGALWAALHAFGSPPPPGAVVMAYFIGQLANALPIPGGIGGVEGGTIGALLAFGAPGSVAVLGVLAYRLVSFWLPTLPGALAYVRLRRTVDRWRAAGTEVGQPARSGPETATVTRSDG
jgi:uncharacterized protein (TIRG00374 family)